MNASNIIQAMSAILDAPGYPLLKFYKFDFANNKLQIQSEWHPAMRMLWIVRECGTHLGTMGVHARGNEELRVVIDNFKYNEALNLLDCFLITGQGVSKVTADYALNELKRLDYVTRDEKVMDATGVELASFDLHLIQNSNQLTGDVAFITQNMDVMAQRQHHIALMQIANAEVTNAWQSLWAKPRKVTLNGANLFALLRTEEAQTV